MAEQKESELERILAEALASAVPELAAEERIPVAREFLQTVDRTMKFVEGVAPSPASGAALIFVYQKLGLDQVRDEQSGKLILTLVSAMNRIHAQLTKKKKVN